MSDSLDVVSKAKYIANSRPKPIGHNQTANTGQYNIEHLHDLFCTACFVMATQPAVNNLTKTGYWPDTLPDWLSYSTDSDAVVLSKRQATTKQFSQYEEAISLSLDVISKANVSIQSNQVPMCSKEQIKLIWDVCQTAYNRKRGPAWKSLSKLHKCSARSVRRNYEEALYMLMYASYL